MNKLIQYLLLSFAISACSPKYKKEPSKAFVLTGAIEQIKNGSKVFLIHNNKLDSTTVREGKFVFRGLVKDSADRIMIRTSSFNFYYFIWVEPGNIKVIKRLGRNSPKIFGSAVQKSQDTLNQSLAKLNSLQNKIAEKIKTHPEVEASKFMIQLDSIQTQIDTVTYRFAKAHFDSPVTLELLRVYYSAWGKSKVLPLFKQLSSKYRETEAGKEISTFLTYNKDIQEGDHFADFQQNDINGNTIKLSKFKNKVILLDFWASWCSPCRRQNNYLKRIYSQYRKSGFEIVSVSIDEDWDDWIQALKEDQIPWTNVSSPSGKKNIAALTYGVSELPSNVLINKDGVVLKRNFGMEYLEEVLPSLVK